MNRCWAECLGDCEGKISGEHIISKSLFASEHVDVTGFPWCKNETKRIGLGSLTKNMLCQKHNSRLSPLDSAAAHAFNVLRNQTKLANDRGKNPGIKYRTETFNINATALERWLLKTLINMGFGGELYIGPQSTKSGWPSDDLVQILYKNRQFPKENGLFVAFKTGQKLNFIDQVSFAPLIKDQHYIYGGKFTFRGVYMFLDLVPGGLRVPFEQIPGDDENWHNVILSKTFKQIRATHRNRISHVVNFNRT